MRKFGLIGYPLGHSFSKKYFTEKFQNEHIPDCSYDIYPLKEISEFEQLIINEPELCGLNVTIPYKSEIFRYLDHIDKEADEIGAANVLKFKRLRGQTKIYGYNSDVTGIRDSLSPCLNQNVKNALVLGTGGSSKAVCYVLKESGLNIIQVSREAKPGLIVYSDIDADLLSSIQLIINTTPLGMFPGTDTAPSIPYNHLSEKHILFDLVYNPEFTLFLRKGMEHGCVIISGLKMLHSQAERSWEIWNNDI